MKKQKIIGVLLSLVGIPIFLFGLILFLVVVAQSNNAVRTTAIVIDQKSKQRGGKTEYQPVLSYQNTKGETKQFVGAIANYSPRFEIGEEVDIYYDPERENSAQIDTAFDTYFLPFILTFFGLGCIIFGIGFFKGKVKTSKLKRPLTYSSQK